MRKFWSKSSANPILDADDAGAESWENENLYNPKVVHNGTTYEMWYSAGDSFANNTYDIGRATSNDGITWTRDTANNPCLQRGGASAWDESAVHEGCVIREDASTYKMWYAGRDSGGTIAVGYATSSDGITWSKDGDNPIIDVGTGGAFDDEWVSKPWVIKRSASDYRMWYTAYDGADSPVVTTIGYATSTNGTSWSKQGQVLSSSGNLLVYPCVIEEDSVFKMFVQIGPNGGPYDTTLFVSDDGQTNWRQVAQMNLRRGQPGDWDDDYIGVPCIVDTPSGREMWYSARSESDAGSRRYHSIGHAILETYTGGAADG